MPDSVGGEVNRRAVGEGFDGHVSRCELDLDRLDAANELETRVMTVLSGVEVERVGTHLIWGFSVNRMLPSPLRVKRQR